MRRTRRNHGAAFKAQVAFAAVKGDKTLAELATQFSVHPTQITEWKQHVLARAVDVCGGTKSPSDVPDLMAERKAMITRAHARPVVRQCQLLELARSTAYTQPRPISASDLALMRRIDELHLTAPFAGARMLRDLLRSAGHRIGRKRVRTMMARMGIKALYRNPHLSQRHPAHRVYPYLLRHLAITRPNHV